METLVAEKIGIKNKIVSTKSKTKTQLLLEKMERGEYVSDYEYLSSIPGYMESLDEVAKGPFYPIDEVWPDWDKNV